MADKQISALTAAAALADADLLHVVQGANSRKATGTQLKTYIGTYTDEQVRDVIGVALVQGSGITITVNDAADTITIAASGGGGVSRGQILPLSIGLSLN